MINLSRKNFDGDRCYVSVFFLTCVRTKGKQSASLLKKYEEMPHDHSFCFLLFLL